MRTKKMFNDDLLFGKRGQDILINFLERHFGYRFEAGERNGAILNTDLIEELENCEFVPPTIRNGARLKFIRENKEYSLTMPDVLMSRNSSEAFYWIEAKTHVGDHLELRINKSTFLDYKMLYETFTRQKFYVMCLNPNEFAPSWDIYFCEIGKLIDNTPIENLGRDGNVILVWSIDEVMMKLNKYPINVEKYQ